MPTASLVPTTAATAIDTATGSTRSPVPNGVYPRTNWKYCVIRKVNPARVKNPIVIEPLAALNLGLRNKRTSSIGWVVRRSASMNTASTTSPAAMVASVRPDPHPQLGAWMMLNTRAPMAALESSNPRRSICGTDGSFDVGTRRATAAPMAIASGTMNTNTLPHQNCSSSQPPTMGPAATPTPVVAPHSPMALARSDRSVNTLAISDSVDGKIPAAPTPITAREAISADALWLSAPARLPRPNTASPASSVP